MIYCDKNLIGTIREWSDTREPKGVVSVKGFLSVYNTFRIGESDLAYIQGRVLTEKGWEQLGFPWQDPRSPVVYRVLGDSVFCIYIKDGDIRIQKVWSIAAEMLDGCKVGYLSKYIIAEACYPRTVLLLNQWADKMLFVPDFSSGFRE